MAEKEKSNIDVVSKIEKMFGKGSLMKMSEKPVEKIEVVSTGSFSLDLALGVGGVPKGRIIEIYGPESSGKSTLTYHLIAEGQKKGIKCAIIDSEYSFDAPYAKNLGIDLDLIWLNQPSNAEEALQIADMLAESGDFGIIIIDSVAAMVPKSELDGEMGDSKMGVMARLMSQALRKMTGHVGKNNVIMVFINQIREKIGVMFGNPEVTTGGNALKFYSSIRLDVRRSTQIKEGDEVVGNLTKVKVVKNKVAPPFRVAEFNIEYGKGIDRLGEIINFAVEYNIIKKSGSWFSYGETKIGQGLPKVRSMLLDNPELLEEVEKKVIEYFNGSYEEMENVENYDLELEEEEED